jgi:hypothetical protein
MSSSKNKISKGTLRLVFIRVYRLEIANSCVPSVMLVFSTELWDLHSHVLPLSPSLWGSTPLSPSLCE